MRFYARFIRVPAMALVLASLILLPTYFAQAHQSDSSNHGSCDERPHRSHLPMSEVVEVDTAANTILAESSRPTRDGEEAQYILITYSDATTFNLDGEQIDEFGISVGDKLHARGEVNLESDDYFAEIEAAHVLLWDEVEPRRPHRRQR
jgi:hypothetical protein